MATTYTPASTWALTAAIPEDFVDPVAAGTFNPGIQTALDRTQYLYDRSCKSRVHLVKAAPVTCPGNSTNTQLWAPVGNGYGNEIEINVGIVYSYANTMSAKLRITIDGDTSSIDLAQTTNFNGSYIFAMHRHVKAIPIAGYADCVIDIRNITAAPAYDLTVHSAWLDFQVWGAP